jgi:hypothetical protein
MFHRTRRDTRTDPVSHPQFYKGEPAFVMRAIDLDRALLFTAATLRDRLAFDTRDEFFRKLLESATRAGYRSECA